MKKAPKTIESILAGYPRHPQNLIGLLQDVQAEYSYISPEHLALICDHVGVPLTQAWAVATFYKSFSLEPRGEHEIRVCLGTTCHLKGGNRLVEACERDLGVAGAAPPRTCALPWTPSIAWALAPWRRWSWLTQTIWGEPTSAP